MLNTVLAIVMLGLSCLNTYLAVSQGTPLNAACAVGAVGAFGAFIFALLYPVFKRSEPALR